MQEIKVGTLTKEESKEFKELQKLKVRVETLMAQSNSAFNAFGRMVEENHSLPPGHYYISGNSICRQDI